MRICLRKLICYSGVGVGLSIISVILTICAGCPVDSESGRIDGCIPKHRNQAAAIVWIDMVSLCKLRRINPELDISANGCNCPDGRSCLTLYTIHLITPAFDLYARSGPSGSSNFAFEGDNRNILSVDLRVAAD